MDDSDSSRTEEEFNVFISKVCKGKPFKFFINLFRIKQNAKFHFFWNLLMMLVTETTKYKLYL